MSSTIEQLSPTRVKIHIDVTPEEFKPALEKAYKEISKNIQIPGFRKGHVPAPIIDQRVGRGAVIEQAINDNLDTYYQSAVREHDVKTLGRPNADIVELPNVETLQGDLKIAVEVDVRPEFELPDVADVTVEVEPAAVTDADVDEELEHLRERFATLTKVERPAAKGDFTTIDLQAKIDDEVIDDASNISYEIGSGQLLDGIDEALETLTAGETTTFESKLVGGDHEGETALIEVTLNAVKERELPEADDDFAQLASEYDTIAELRDSLKDEAAKRKSTEQVGQARGKLVEALLEKVELPLPEDLVDAEVKAHLEQEGKSEDDPHAAEVRPDVERGIRTQLLLDKVVDDLQVQLGQDELSQYLVQQSMQYGIEPNEFFKIISEQGQLPALFGEISRSKAISTLLGKVKVVDTDGNTVDLSEYLPKDAEAEADETAEPASDESAEDALDQVKAPAKKAPAKKAAAKKAPAKKAAAKTAAEAEETDAE
ncbi:trigger factor [Pseudoclavibacter sp. CFCC 11306]|uniref:trigger factor n=1 Tax=Pseudoclavibacter sp. CFCC 11306 TaxID=1564493 RepID=UPI0013010E12|nr:trigger factor [Pseudoclavibacter sp. CFCC 11306]KAB1658575.1 trigger factor [Pseudoclavibacter sp. CFCC 11306]